MESSSHTGEKFRVVIATHNQHKFEELRIAFNQLPVNCLPFTDWNLEPIAETGATFVENAILKARYACQISGLSAIADDSGLSVDLLNGEPGVHSSRYAGELASDEENNTLLLERIQAKRRRDEPVFACFKAILVYLEHQLDPTPIIAEGRWRGSIIDAPRGEHGFGYDPLFLPIDSTYTAAELDPSVKNQESHRAKAARKLVALLLDRRVDDPTALAKTIESKTQEVESLS